METFVEFSARHQGNPVDIGKRLLFPDGAAVTYKSGIGTAKPTAVIFEEPPADSTARAEVIRRYHLSRVDVVTNERNRVNRIGLRDSAPEGWDVAAYGPRPANCVTAVATLDNVIDWHRRMAAATQE